jgi:hypothetical protein
MGLGLAQLGAADRAPRSGERAEAREIVGAGFLDTRVGILDTLGEVVAGGVAHAPRSSARHEAPDRLRGDPR